MNVANERPIDRWFASYSSDHRDHTNQLIHLFAVPAILWSVIALLWCLPVFGTRFQSGIWAVLATFAAWTFYNRLSPQIGYGMLAVFFVMACTCRLIEQTLGLPFLFWSAVTVFVVAWIAQFVGHRFEGRKPSFFTDLVYLLIGPIWVLSKLYRSMGWKY